MVAGIATSFPKGLPKVHASHDDPARFEEVAERLRAVQEEESEGAYTIMALYCLVPVASIAILGC
jgi:hypothetical protein